MIAIAATRRSATSLVAKHHAHFQPHIRLLSSMTPVNKDDEKNNNNSHKTTESSKRREMHSTARNRQSDVARPFTVETPVTTSSSTSSSTSTALMDRFTTTFEVTVSKIFPAGFGWQTSSVMAENMGFGAESLNFALTTGLGDAIGVLGGHTAYYAAKKAVTGADSSIDMTQEVHTGILLGSAAFCSGTAWQPIVNVLQGANLPFNQVFLGTWMGCGAAFYVGLRLSRTMLSDVFAGIEDATYENSKNDLALSAAIGGATGFFVGTDAAYMPQQNFLIDMVGIQDGTPDLMGAAIAGSSTSLGFLSAQTAMNLTYPTGKCWND